MQTPQVSIQDIKTFASYVRRWRQSPDGFVLFAREAIGEELLGGPLTDHQVEMLRAILIARDDPTKRGVSVRAGQGTGKSEAAAIIILAWLICFPNSLVVATATTQNQIRSVLWGKLDKFIRGSKFLSAVLEWQATRIGVRGEAVQWQAIATTASSMESVAGQHRKDFLFVADEASGIDDFVLESMLYSLTEPNNKALLLSNPTRTSGMFYETHCGKQRDIWLRCHFSSRNSPLVSAAHIALTEAANGGPDSPVVKMRIDGEFPRQSNRSLIALEWLTGAKDRELLPEEDGPVIVGVDPSRYGEDRTGIVARRGDNVLMVDAWSGMDTVGLAHQIAGLTAKFPDIGVVRIDSCGLGAGVMDVLLALQSTDHKLLNGASIEGINASDHSDDAQKWFRLRDQLWCEFAERLKDGRLAFHHTVDRQMIDRLTTELLAAEYGFKPNGARYIETKDQMRKKLKGQSPDLADAMLLAFHENFCGFVGFL